MTHVNHATPLNGEAKAQAQRRRVWRAMLIPGAITIGVLFAIRKSLGGVTFSESPLFAIIGSAVIVIFTILGSIWHHRSIDEHEEQAILWSNTVGFYTLIATAFSAEILELAGVLPRVSHITVMLVAFAGALATYGWHRLR